MRRWVLSALAVSTLVGTAQAQAPGPIKIAMLNDQSSIYSASADFIRKANDLP